MLHHVLSASTAYAAKSAGMSVCPCIAKTNLQWLSGASATSTHGTIGQLVDTAKGAGCASGALHTSLGMQEEEEESVPCPLKDWLIR